jgi:ubiquinone/menaquinone biosynthesis C-methylase UbiE
VLAGDLDHGLMKQHTVANFDRLARPYALLERLIFGRALARRRLCFLADPRLASVRRALVLGDGDGRFTAALCERYPALEITALDASAAMLAELAGRVRRVGTKTIDLQCADAREWVAARPGYDLVVTHFFFDCFSSADVAAIVARVARVSTPNSRWLVSDFRIPTQGARAVLAKLLVRALYFGSWLLTGLNVWRLPEHEPPLKEAGFTRASTERALFGALFSELWERGCFP